MSLGNRPKTAVSDFKMLPASTFSTTPLKSKPEQVESHWQRGPGEELETVRDGVERVKVLTPDIEIKHVRGKGEGIIARNDIPAGKNYNKALLYIHYRV